MSNDTALNAGIEWYENADWGNEDYKDGVVRGFLAGADWQRSQQSAAALKAKAAVPDGHALIPARIELSPEDIACIMLQCGGDEEATEIDEQFNGGVLWVGSLRDDDGSETYGLHIACVGYLEEGSTTIAEFEAAPARPQSDVARYSLLRARFDGCKSSQCELMQDFLGLDGEPHETLDALMDRAMAAGPEVE